MSTLEDQVLRVLNIKKTPDPSGLEKPTSPENPERRGVPGTMVARSNGKRTTSSSVSKTPPPTRIGLRISEEEMICSEDEDDVYEIITNENEEVMFGNDRVDRVPASMVPLYLSLVSSAAAIFALLFSKWI